MTSATRTPVTLRMQLSATVIGVGAMKLILWFEQMAGG
jgi:hypothetical protein